MAVLYQDFRSDTAAAPLWTDTWLARSRDGGATWTDLRLGGSFDLTRAPFANGLFLGDYMGLAADDGRFLPLVVRSDVAAERSLGALWKKDVVLRGGFGTTFLSPRPLPFGQSSAAVFLVDAQVGVRRDFLELGLESTNLLGARYAETEYAFVSNWRSTQVPSYLPARHLTAGPPRQVMFTMGVHL